MDKQTIQEAAEKWAKWYANEGSYQEWLKLPTSPFGQEGKFAACLRHAKSGFLAGSHSIGEEIVKRLEGANPFTHQEESLPFEPTNANEGWKKCVESLRSLINQQALTNKDKEV